MLMMKKICSRYENNEPSFDCRGSFDLYVHSLYIFCVLYLNPGGSSGCLFKLPLKGMVNNYIPAHEWM